MTRMSQNSRDDPHFLTKFHKVGELSSLLRSIAPFSFVFLVHNFFYDLLHFHMYFRVDDVFIFLLEFMEFGGDIHGS